MMHSLLRLLPVISLLVLLVAAGGVITYQVNQRIEANTAPLKQDVISSVNLVRRAAAERVVELADSGIRMNGGFFVFEHGVLDYLSGDETILERDPLERLAQDGELMDYRHEGFWEPMDTERDRTNLVNLWATGKAPWRVWDG